MVSIYARDVTGPTPSTCLRISVFGVRVSAHAFHVGCVLTDLLREHADLFEYRFQRLA